MRPGHVALVVDDEPMVCALLEDALSEQGIEVSVAEGVADATLLLEDGLRPCLAIVDQRLRGQDGSVLVKLLRSDPRFARVGVVAISAQPERLAALSDTGVALLAKPFELEQLDQIENYCGGHARPRRQRPKSRRSTVPTSAGVTGVTSRAPARRAADRSSSARRRKDATGK